MGKCPYCGREIDGDAYFCLYCMKELKGRTAIKTRSIVSTRRIKGIVLTVLSVLAILLGCFFVFKGNGVGDNGGSLTANTDASGFFGNSHDSSAVGYESHTSSVNTESNSSFDGADSDTSKDSDSNPSTSVSNVGSSSEIQVPSVDTPFVKPVNTYIPAGRELEPTAYQTIKLNDSYAALATYCFKEEPSDGVAFLPDYVAPVREITNTAGIAYVTDQIKGVASISFDSLSGTGRRSWVHTVVVPDCYEMILHSSLSLPYLEDVYFMGDSMKSDSTILVRSYSKLEVTLHCSADCYDETFGDYFKNTYKNHGFAHWEEWDGKIDF